MDPSLFQITYQVRERDCDWTGKLALGKLMGILMLASSQQERDLFGQSSPLGPDRTWVVLQNEVHLNQLPDLGQEILLQTQALSYNRFFTYRVYRILDQDQELMVEATVAFAVMDMVERKIISLSQEMIEAYPFKYGKQSSRLAKMPQLDWSQAQVEQRVTQVSDLDYNQHVNNNRYLDWVCDQLGLDFLKHHQLRRCHIFYEREIAYGQGIDLLLIQDQMTTYHRMALDQETHCQMVCQWQVLEEEVK